MSMLAGPRRKQKFSADPRGNAWSKDDSKFGQKLMEKFGWTKGKGLGANEDGKVDNVTIAVKNNTQGVGCTKNHADNWIAHQDDFNDLLSSLNQNASEQTTAQDDTSKVIGLEEKSKASRSRVHYQKFTKGKDLSSKSREDMACIFGKRQIKSGPKLVPSSEQAPCDGEEKTEHGVVTVRSTDNVHDYFAKKMAEKKAAMSTTGHNQSEDVLQPELGMRNGCDNDTSNKLVKKKVRFSLGAEDEITEDLENKLKEKKKKSKKNKKLKLEEKAVYESLHPDCKGEVNEVCDGKDGTTKRKRKRTPETQEEVGEENQVRSKKAKKNKKVKNKSGDSCDSISERVTESDKVCDVIENGTVTENKNPSSESLTQDGINEPEMVTKKKSKKAKKTKNTCDNGLECTPEKFTSVKSKKKKKKKKPVIQR